MWPKYPDSCFSQGEPCTVKSQSSSRALSLFRYFAEIEFLYDLFEYYNLKHYNLLQSFLRTEILWAPKRVSLGQILYL